MARCTISSRKPTEPMVKLNSRRKCLVFTSRCSAPSQRGTKLPNKKRTSELHEGKVSKCIRLFHRLAQFEQLVGRDILQHLNGTAGPSDFDPLYCFELACSEVDS